MNTRITQIAYLLGISLILTSILYFFASNWAGFERMTKITLALLLIVFFYTIHLLLKKWVTWQPFLSNWMLIAASIVFGIAVALIGQVYNSHADSYLLFLVWLIPVLLLAILTRYPPFYVLSYLLSQATMLFFIFPSSFLPEWRSDVLLLMLMGMVVFNSCLFFLVYRKILESKTMLYLTYSMFLAVFFYVVIDEMLPFHVLWNFIYAVILTGSIYYWFKHRPHKKLLTITSIFAAVFTIFRTFYWALQTGGEFIFYLLLFFAIVLTLIGAVIVGILNKDKMNSFVSNLLILIITFISTLFATAAISGLFSLFFPTASAVVLYFFALIFLILPGLFATIAQQFRYSLLGTGFLLAFFTALLAAPIFYHLILLIPLCIGIYIIERTGVKVLAYLFTNIVLAYVLFDLTTAHVMCLVLLLLNTGYYLLATKNQATNGAAFLIAIISFLSLTLLDTFFSLQIIYNSAFLLGVPFLLFLLRKNSKQIEWRVLIAFWFLFLGIKYYEYWWTLLHKSIVALVLGLLFLSVAYFLDRPTKTMAPTGALVTYKVPLFIAVIVLQLGFIGYQAYTNETLLREGEEIKVELEPVDPRSMLQGDYMALHYDINDIDEGIMKGKVKVVLREKDGAYRYAGYYQKDNEWNKPYHKKSGDVIINGKVHGYNQVHYGIESFFIPEGTGIELEREVEYAYVRVSKSGDAIIESVE